MYPTTGDPAYGIFVATQMSSVERLGVHVDVEFVNGRRSNLEYAKAVQVLRRLVAGTTYDVVHAHYGLTGFVSAFQSRPLVVSFCGDDLLGTPRAGGITLKSRIGISLSRLAARRAEGIICKSEELRAALPRSAQARAHVLGNGVDTDRFQPGERSAARQRLGLDPHERLIIFPHSRRQLSVKRFDLAEAAIALLPGMGIEARMWVVNDVAPSAMPDYYRAADCMLLTSDHEGSPNTLKEALCCDLPVVSVDVGDVRRWLALVPGCRLVERDPASIARGIADVLSLARSVDGSWVRQEIGLISVAGRVVEVYREAIGRRTSGK